MTSRSIRVSCLACVALLSHTPTAFAERTFRDWSVACETDGCTAATTLSAPDSTWLATLQVVPAEGGADLVMRLPLGIHISSGVFISDGRTTLYPGTFTRCDQTGCRAILSMPPEMVDGWRAARKAQIRYRPASDAPVVAFEASLMGFTRAFAAAGDGQ
ncbi:MAG: invasion associated locus B family protein [Pseudomonadota bacterium]